MASNAPAFSTPIPHPLKPVTSFSPLSRRVCKTKPTRVAPRRTFVTPVARVRRGFRPSPEVPPTLFDAKPIRDADFEPFDFSSLKGHVVLVVNSASEDDKADEQFKMLSDLLEKHHSFGFDVIVFPSNWYGQYETRPVEEVKKFIHSKYSPFIKVMSKTDIDWNQVFALGRKYFPGEIIWNFHGKFLFGKKGLPVDRFDLLSTAEHIDSQVSHFLHSSDESIHITTAPAIDYEDDDEWSILKDKTISVEPAVVEDEEAEAEEEEEEEEEGEEPEVDGDVEESDGDEEESE